MLREAFQKVKRKETVDIIKSHLLLSSRNAGEYRPDAWKSKAAILRNLSVSMTELKARRMLKIDTGNLKCFLTLLASAEKKSTDTGTTLDSLGLRRLPYFWQAECLTNKEKKEVQETWQ